MALEYSSDALAQSMQLIGRGAVAVDDRSHFVRRFLGDPDLPALAGVLIDVNAMTTAPIAEVIPVLGMLIETLQSRLRGKVAIAKTTVGHVTLSHLASASVGDSHGQVRVFASESEARAWVESRSSTPS
jgi:hypothetical protein